MRGCFTGLLLIVVAASSSVTWSQGTKARKAVAPVDKSQAHAWAEAVTDFVTDRRLLETFPQADVAERFKALVPPGSVIVERGDSPAGNPEKGVARLRFEIGDRDDGKAIVDSVTIYMPRTDLDGADVLPRVIASMKRKLHRPWVSSHFTASGPDDPEGWNWDQREALLQVTVRPVKNIPDLDGGRNGSWVSVSFGHVEGFGEP